MTVRFSTGLRTQMLGENGVDSGANGFRGVMKDGVLELRTGAQPASADDAAAGTLIAYITNAGATFTPGAPDGGLEWDAPTAGVISKAAAETWKTDAALATGVIGHFRLRANAADTGISSTSLPRVDGSVAKTGANINLSNTSATLGDPLTVDKLTLNFNMANV